MNRMSTSTELGDAADRTIAVTTFDRNLIVTAGAGTGKTTLLIDRLVHLLLRNPEPLKITDIVALTFTNKAADEMKLRLRQRLQAFLAVQLDRAAVDADHESVQRDVEGLIALYRLSKDELDTRVRDALKNLERSEIGTIHSFAANLLRLYPLEAAVDPRFREDDGTAFDLLFEDQWEQWLGEELSLQSPHAVEWEKILSSCTVNEIKALARSMAVENVDLRQSPGGIAERSPALTRWLEDLESRAAELIDRHPEDRVNEKLIGAARAMIQAFQGTGRPLEPGSDESIFLSEKSINPGTQGWSAADVQQARELVRAARALARVDGDLGETLWRLLVPYARGFRERFVREGHLSFDALLVRARDLVRDQPRVRAELKRRYRTILVDEFQDTDPIQYEILLYLAEEAGRAAADWRQIRVAPGKIFVVGDPKQSIYAFRRADIEAYLEVIERVIRPQSGIECRLTTNFRSNEAILDGVNGIFEAIIQAQDGLQPPYIAIHPAPGRSAGTGEIPQILIRKIVSEDEMNAEAARHLEGQSLARWLQEQILGKLVIRNTRGEMVSARAKDVALLLRKLTDIHDYLEPLRRHGIRYVVEGERHFYAAREIVDAVNLLRAIENPQDRLALVGVLRSPLGGLTDQQIYDLHRQNLLDYRLAAKLSGAFPPSLPQLYDALERLHRETPTLPIGAAVAHVFDALPVEILAASSFQGEQAVANLQKLVAQAEHLGREGLTTLQGAIRQLEKRVLEVKDEAESALAEESLDAVRIMSIHKAKGLEFPIVILAGCQGGIDSRHGSDATATFDWSTGLTGLHIGATSDLAGVYIAEKSRRRSAEEQKRLLYVAMTRAREHLVISCAPAIRRARESFCSMLDGPLGGAIGAAKSSAKVPLGRGSVEIQVNNETLCAPTKAQPKTAAHERQNWQSFLDCWARRSAAYEDARRSAIFLTPTALKPVDKIVTEAGCGFSERAPQRPPALVVGDLAHRFLQRWDFSGTPDRFERELRDWVGSALADGFNGAREPIENELKEIFSGFLGSPVWTELTGAKILGREVPLLIPWNDQIMEGVIDLIYERGGLLHLADYKTDRLAAGERMAAAERYRVQAEIYSQAVTRALGRTPAAFKIIFLRLGAAVELCVDKQGAAQLI